MRTLDLALISVFAPLIIAVLLIIVAPLRRAGRAAAALSVGGAFASVFASVALTLARLADNRVPEIFETTWLPEAGKSAATIGLQIDGISAPMLAVVSIVAFCVQVFSLEYMADENDEDYGRYFTWHSLFLFSMQALVVAPNILQLFCAWELVGLCSYLLIGFYYKKPSAARAALKAFWVTKFADLGLLIGLIVQYAAVGTFGWDAETVAKLGALGVVPVAVAALYFLAVMGKSAQFPLHVWLPDAMEGPTPVSALLHAATMVAAGVYLIVRAYPIFQAAPQVMVAMSVIGGVTAVFAAIVAIGQNDIKRVLAYSTCSQLGYMVAALGAGSLFGGYFHLGTHAFFKAMLFLSAGSVIHAVHSNDLSHMGGLSKKMKWTTLTFSVGSLALAGFPGLSGFFSKDQILESLWEGTHRDPLFWIPFLACLATVGITAYYMSRVVFLAFFGKLGEHAHHAHEGGIAMRLPLLILLVPTVIGGLFGGQFLGLLALPEVEFHLTHVTPVGVVALVLAFGGIGLGYVLNMTPAGAGLASATAPVAAFIEYGAVDRFWLGAYNLLMMALSRVFAWLDRYVVDGMLNGIGAGALTAGEWLRRFQTGRATDYVYVVMLGVVGLTIWSQFAALVGGSR